MPMGGATVAVAGAALMPGRGLVLSGRYELGEVLGAGGMATVFQAHDRLLDREVAVKVLRDQYSSDPVFLARFTREARHAARLSHPGLVTVFDTGVQEGTAFIVMELVRGRTLRQVLTSDGRLPVTEAVRIAASVCEVLDVAHHAGIVHRDIKPGNILLSDDGRIRVFDFGIARTDGSDALTRTATVLGTAAYIAPEQAAGRAAGPQSDLYAVGCVLVEMLTGAPPFAADDPIALLYQHIHDQPAAPSASRSEVPPALDAVTLRLLAKDPADRPATADQARGELLAALADPLGDTRLLPAPHMGPARASRWLQPTRLMVATGILGAALVLLVVLALQHMGAAARSSASTPSPSASTATSPVTTPTSASPPTETPIAVPTATTASSALTALRSVIAAGQAAGLVSPSAASQLSQAAGDIANALDKGHGKPERPKIGALQDLVRTLADQGQIQGSALSAINQAVDQLSRLISHKD
jgi:serine/threonine protein kinase